MDVGLGDFSISLQKVVALAVSFSSFESQSLASFSFATFNCKETRRIEIRK